MRWSRLVIVSGLVALALIGAGWALAASGSSGSGHRARAATAVRGPSVSLQRQLQQLLARRGIAALPPRVLPRDLLPRDMMCPVAAGGSCSLIPCIVFVHGATAPVAAAAASAVVLERPVSIPAPRGVNLGTAREASCHAPPRTLRVSGP